MTTFLIFKVVHKYFRYLCYVFKYYDLVYTLYYCNATSTSPQILSGKNVYVKISCQVELGEEGGGYHSVFACPILRQQASEQNPPMRLLCGHVISRDALNKLAMGVKLVHL